MHGRETAGGNRTLVPGHSDNALNWGLRTLTTTNQRQLHLLTPKQSCLSAGRCSNCHTAKHLGCKNARGKPGNSSAACICLAVKPPLSQGLQVCTCMYAPYMSTLTCFCRCSMPPASRRNNSHLHSITTAAAPGQYNNANVTACLYAAQFDAKGLHPAKG